MALFTAQEFKDHEGLTGTTHDTFIGQLATRVSLMVARYTHRISGAGVSLLEAPGADVAEYYDGTGRADLRLRRFPIISVTSLHIDADRTFDSGTLIAATDYTFDDFGFLRFLPQEETGFEVRGLFTRGTNNVKVVYQGGYATIPADLVEGALMWAAAIFARRRSAGMLSQSIGGWSASWEQGGVPQAARMILAPFRDLGPHVSVKA